MAAMRRVSTRLNSYFHYPFSLYPPPPPCCSSPTSRVYCSSFHKPLLASSRAFFYHRSKLHYLLDADSPNFRITIFRNSSQFTRASCNSTMPFHGKKVTKKKSKLVKDSTTESITSINEPSNADSFDLNETHIEPLGTGSMEEERERLSCIYEKVLVVDNTSVAKEIVGLLTTQYRHLVHACKTEVAKIDIDEETPVDHGDLICFSIYCGPEVDFRSGKSCIWVDVLDGGGRDILIEFAPFLEDPLIKKVWHNYSFDSHIFENYGLKISGYHADTMHMAHLWDSSRVTENGYSLEALTSDEKVMSGGQISNGGTYRNRRKPCGGGDFIGNIPMKTIFGKKKTKRDGCPGKLITIPPVDELQREEREIWICYSSIKSINTLMLFESLKSMLMNRCWNVDGLCKGTMYDFYEEYWRPFGELLVKMETDGMWVDRAYLAKVQAATAVEQQSERNVFCTWASQYCPDALYMNVKSDAQLRQLFFGGALNRKDKNEALPCERTFKVPVLDNVTEEGKSNTNFRSITLHKIGDQMRTGMYTASGWPSVSGDALKKLAVKISTEYDSTDDPSGFESDDKDNRPLSEDIDPSSYGRAYAAFGGGKSGREACHAIAALCNVCSIEHLISNFIVPLQDSHVFGKDGRIHCSLNINTTTGRLSARRPNLQNQPALEKDKYKIRQAFTAAPGNSLIVADYEQLELRILAHLTNCKSMLDTFRAGGDFHSRTAVLMYPYIRESIDRNQVLLEWNPQAGEEKPPIPLLMDVFASERRRAKTLHLSIAYGRSPAELAREWKVSVREVSSFIHRWYEERREVLAWKEAIKMEVLKTQCVYTLLGRSRVFPPMEFGGRAQKGHIERAAINTPIQGSAADVTMCAMLEISRNADLKMLGWKLILQVHDEVILEGPTESAEMAKAIVIECMSKPFYGYNYLKVDLPVNAKCAPNWYAAKYKEGPLTETPTDFS